MKTSFALRCLALILTAGIITPNLIQAQIGAVASQPGQALIGYQIGERGPDQRVWRQIVQVTDAKGNTVSQTNQAYVELATGLNYWDAASKQWLESKEEIDACPNGAIAQYGPNKVIFAGDLNSAVAVDMQTPDGQRLQSRVIGLSYFDVASGKSIGIAEVTDSAGQIIPPNQVIYPAAFTGVQADVCYTYTKAGLEQDVVLRECPPAPEMFGLSSASTRLQVLTEFVSAPQPVIGAVKLPASAGGLEDDQTVSFGVVKMRPGKAFVIGTANDDWSGIPVRKLWTTIDGRTILVEDVAFSAIAAKLKMLPAPVNQPTVKTLNHSVPQVVSTKPLLPASKLDTAAKRPMKIAKGPVSSRGMVIDYTTMTDRTNFTFQCDTTYLISGTVNLSGHNTVEGGTVLKFVNANTAKIRIYGSASNSLSFQTAPYHPAVFTSKDDNFVGDKISGSSANPVQGNATYLEIHGDGYYSTPIRNARFLFASNAISQLDFYNTLSPVWDCQFVQCATAFSASPTCSPSHPLELHNVLFSQCGILFADTSGSIGQGIIGEQVTADQIGYLLHSGGYYSGCDVYLTNSILTAVGPIYPATGSTNLDPYPSCQTSPFGGSASGFYQTKGAGNYYLPPCQFPCFDGFHSAGNPNITSAMLQDLANKTTYPPAVLTNDFNSDTVLTNGVALLDNSGYPDLGYHYDPLDYCWSGLNISNATLALVNGVAVANYGRYGTYLQTGSAVVSTGTALNHNQLTYYTSVQEEPMFWGITNKPACLIYGVSRTNNVRFHFTDVSLLAGGWYFIALGSSSGFAGYSLRDCQLTAINTGYQDQGTYSQIIGWTNNIFQRCALTFYQYSNPYQAALYNNLFLGGSLAINLSWQNWNWTVADNLFDAVTLSASGVSSTNYDNAYYKTTAFAHQGGVNVILTNIDFQPGPLGNYYYPPTGINLVRLIDAGSRSAAAAGLALYTTQTNQVSEGCSTVDIGFHYKGDDSGILMTATNCAALQMAQLLVPPGVWITNATYTGAIEARGIFSNGITAGFPINYGVILSSGYITNAIGPNNDSGSDGVLFKLGDPDLDKLVGGSGTEDAAVLEFDIISTNSFALQFQYIFASEEYPEYIGPYNDPMAIFVSTNRVDANWINSITNDIALAPGTTNVPVSVNNINGGCVSDYSFNYHSPTNAQYYVDNHDPIFSAVPPYAASAPVYNLQYDGFTTLLTAQTLVSANTTNHIKIAIADYGDAKLDSAVFVRAQTSCP